MKLHIDYDRGIAKYILKELENFRRMQSIKRKKKHPTTSTPRISHLVFGPNEHAKIRCIPLHSAQCTFVVNIPSAHPQPIPSPSPWITGKVHTHK